MAENIRDNSLPGQPKSETSFEQKKQKALEGLLEASMRFVNFDGDLNDLVKDMTATIATEIKRDPSVLFSTKGDNMEALLSALKSKGGSGVSGGDIFGGSPLSDLMDFIKGIGELAKDEKEFFLKIIFLIFCGDKACECLCKCLCKE